MVQLLKCWVVEEKLKGKKRWDYAGHQSGLGLVGPVMFPTRKMALNKKKRYSNSNPEKWISYRIRGINEMNCNILKNKIKKSWVEQDSFEKIGKC